MFHHTQWQRFEAEIARLNIESIDYAVYKLFYVGRHGQGVHNVVEKYYATAEWDVSNSFIQLVTT